MAEVQAALTMAQVDALISQRSSTSYVGGSNITPITLSQLLASYPASASLAGQYARVSDLYGGVDEILRCRFDGVAYRWVPQRPAFNAFSAATSGTVTITPLLTAPTLRLTGNLTGNLQVSAATTNAFIGQQQRIMQEGVLGLFTSTITGLIGSNLTLLGGSSKVIEFGPTGWFAA